MTKESMIKVLRYKAEHIKAKIKPEFFSEVADTLEKEQRAKGHWIETTDHEENCRTLICSSCDKPAIHDEDTIWKTNFCPHCGARMIKAQESEETDADSD